MSVEKQLQSMRLHSADARKVFDAFRTYENNVEEISVDTLRSKTRLRAAAIRAVLAELQQLELGELIVGRRGRSTRFKWHEDFVDVIPGPVPREPKKGEGPGLPGGTALNQFVCGLSGRREAHLLLPALMSESDLRKIRRFLDRLLPPAA